MVVAVKEKKKSAQVSASCVCAPVHTTAVADSDGQRVQPGKKEVY